MKNVLLKNLNYNTRIFYIVSVAEFWDMVSFFGTVSMLILYTSSIFNFSDQASYLIYGTYLALFCSLPIVGGMITDKYLSEYNSVILGAVLMIVGNLVLFVESKFFLFSGLAATITGTALYKTTCTNLVGKLHSENTKAKNNAYTFFYTVLNCGAILGPISYGIIGAYLGWHYCFLFSAFGVGGCLILFIIFRLDFSRIADEFYVKHKLRKLKALIMVGITFCITTVLLLNFSVFNEFVPVLMATIIAVYLCILSKQKKSHRNRILGLLVLLTICIFFFSASLQVGSSLTLYLDRFVDRKILSWEIPVTFFASLDPLFLVLTAPLFSFLWSKLASVNKEPAVAIKLSLGLCLACLGFICFLFASLSSNFGYYITFISIILGYFFIGAGEICLSPAVLSSISIYSPKNIQNMMMGSWYFFMSIAGYLGGYIDQAITAGGQSSIIDLQHIFIFVVLLTLLTGGLSFLLSKSINALLA